MATNKCSILFAIGVGLALASTGEDCGREGCPASTASDDEVSLLALKAKGSGGTTPTQVSCGGHTAASCEQCTMGNGAAFCNGDCSWNPYSQRCLPKTVVRPTPPPGTTGEGGSCGGVYGVRCQEGLTCLLPQPSPWGSPPPGGYTGVCVKGSGGTNPAQVSCGSHTAASCGQCPMGNGAAYCNGDCSWNPYSQQCLPKTVATTTPPPVGPQIVPEGGDCDGGTWTRCQDGLTCMLPQPNSWGSMTGVMGKCVKGSGGTTPAQVSCGGHTAASCAGCTKGNGASWCNGDCYWVPSRNKCVKKVWHVGGRQALVQTSEEADATVYEDTEDTDNETEREDAALQGKDADIAPDAVPN